MNISHKSEFLRTLVIPLLILFCAIMQPCLCAQEPEAAKYTMEEYKAYQEITAETSAAKKIDLIVKFIQENPKSTLHQHVVAAYQTMMNTLQSNQNWSQLVSCGDRFMKLAPDDAFTISMLATGYQRTNNYKQFVLFGEKVYEKKADGNIAYYMAKAYKDMGDGAKFLLWGDRAIGFLPDNHELLIEMAKTSAIGGKNVQAAKYGKQCIKALQTAKKPDGTDEKLWTQYTSGGYANCYGIVGNVAYEQRDYTNAVANLENSVRYFKKNQMAYYYLGLSYWQLNKVDMAMLNLAKATLLPGPSAGAAKQHFDNLYKTTHQQSLNGQERIVARAKIDLQ